MRYLPSTFLPLLLLLTVFQSPQDSLRQHSEAADAQRRAGNLAAAEREYTAVLAEGYAKLGKVYSAEKNYQQARSALESAISYQPDSQVALIDQQSLTSMQSNMKKLSSRWYGHRQQSSERRRAPHVG